MRPSFIDPFLFILSVSLFLYWPTSAIPQASMQIRFLFLVLLYHVIRVWAGGLQSCMERVLAFQAYEIDGLNKEEIRSIGVSYSR